MRMAPIAKVVATDEPDTAAKIMQVSTQVIGRPPWMPPTIERAKSTRRCEIPPVSIRLPARMKKGIAARGNLSSALNISFGNRIIRSGSEMRSPTDAARPMETATETLNAKQTSIVISMVRDILLPVGEARAPRSRRGARQGESRFGRQGLPVAIGRCRAARRPDRSGAPAAR
jgi:hypothetical protein